MAKGSGIIVSSPPKGVRLEGAIKTAEKPGTVMQVDTSAGIDGNGRLTWEVYAPGTDGNQRMIAVLLPNHLLGKLATDAYTAGDRGFIYVPAPGEELNMLVLNLAGTADDHALGEFLIVDTGTGKLIATTGSPESEPFQLLETITDPTVDTLAHCIYTGY